MAAGAATGLQFHPLTAQALAQALMKLVNLYQDRDTWTKMMKNAMAAPVGWDQSAAAYAALKVGGTLAVWSAWDDRKFEQRLRFHGFNAQSDRVRARREKGGSKHTIFVGLKPTHHERTTPSRR